MAKQQATKRMQFGRLTQPVPGVKRLISATAAARPSGVARNCAKIKINKKKNSVTNRPMPIRPLPTRNPKLAVKFYLARPTTVVDGMDSLDLPVLRTLLCDVRLDVGVLRVVFKVL